MIAIARADDTRVVNIGTPDNPSYLTVPDIKLPQGVDWSAQRIPGGAIILFEHNGRSVATLWDGPYDIGGFSYYIIDAPKQVLQKLRNQLGAGNVAPLIKALRASPALRTWAKAAGFKLVRNGNGKPVTIIPRIVICGQSPVDLDGDDLDEADELLDLE